MPEFEEEEELLEEEEEGQASEMYEHVTLSVSWRIRY